ncbi:MAG: radical SAM protein [Cyanobacteriota bacterium]|nr:radical SAM protein [Cyanobacteriota bacterium]
MPTDFQAVYGPVRSWRYGCSLGIDPIGPVSVCSFNCVYCQLGEIEEETQRRRVFVPTARILGDLQAFDLTPVEVVTLSGSGEPTLALNLGEILGALGDVTDKPLLVLTNATLLADPEVRGQLAQADRAALKLDAWSAEQLARVNRPAPGLDFPAMLEGMERFSAEFGGELALQTMVLSPWTDGQLESYLQLIRRLKPQEIQLNTPTRPKPQRRELAARGNTPGDYPVQVLKRVSGETLAALAQTLSQAAGIPARYPSPEV